MDIYEKFLKTHATSRSVFNDLTQEPTTEEEYQHAQRKWETMGDYHDVYLLTDTLLLADVFENFCEICLATHDLDPAHYYSAPGLAWDAALKST